MRKRFFSFEQIGIIYHLLYWTILVVPVAIATGTLVAFFLWLLDKATAFRWQHLFIIFFLPLAGVVIFYLYNKWGKNTDRGNNLILDEIHEPGGGVPARMTPLILFATIFTHLFGGSAGREGTAVQMGGSLSSLFSYWYRIKNEDKRILLMSGMAAGFGAVFGTPVTGAIFSMEVLAIGKIQYDALLPCLIGSLIADIVCASLGIHHTRYNILFTENNTHIFTFLSFDIALLGKVILASICFGLTSFLFTQFSHFIKDTSVKYIKKPFVIPVIGGSVVIAVSYLLRSWDYLGLGVINPDGKNSIVSAFQPNGVASWSWLWKLLLTAITLSTGFKGGEVTPLFFMGATLGNTLAIISGAPIDLFAGLGFIAVFAGATNTPLACTLMGVELFGAHNIIYYAVACFTAYYFSGHAGIYSSQKTGVQKSHFSSPFSAFTLDRYKKKKGEKQK